MFFATCAFPGKTPPPLFSYFLQFFVRLGGYLRQPPNPKQCKSNQIKIHLSFVTGVARFPSGNFGKILETTAGC